MKKSIVSLILLSIIFSFWACNPKNSKKLSDSNSANTANTADSAAANWFEAHKNDAVHFSEIFPVSPDNPFIFVTFEELITQLKYGTGVVVFAFPACPRCKNAFPVLEKAFKEMNMEQYAGLRGKILYYDIFEDREKNNERYLALVEYLKDFLPVDNNGRPRIYSPDVFFLAAGKIIGNHLDTVPSLKNPRDPLNEEQKAELLKIYKDLLVKVEDCGC